MMHVTQGVDSVDYRIIQQTQGGLPVVPAPFAKIAEDIGVNTEELLKRIQQLMAQGVIRRIGVVPNHYRLGYTANGMTVWDIPDSEVNQAGRDIAALPFVSHCYHRPRHLPEWPYNLFAMVHGHNREEVISLVDKIRSILGDRYHSCEVLYSKRILKKTGMRI